ncbi:hypothetical protein SAY86_030777 [Trapa natans]|uniref:Protein kinase domain-containing protein n=1 Tax=Trapa natans TaxID=22666 RepID=A0AAN7RHF0_TRANT|nr:hypothetical protein SAY86_030777 [Trapa natans]
MDAKNPTNLIDGVKKLEKQSSNVASNGNTSKDMYVRADKFDIKNLDILLEKHLSRVWSRNVESQKPKEEWEIDLSRLNIRYALATGTYGIVFRGTYGDQDVAVKLLDWGEDGVTTIAETAALRASFRQEVAVWQKLDHPNVTKFIGASMGISNLKIPENNQLKDGHSNIPSRACCVVVEFVAGGNLKNFLYRNRRKKLPFKTVIKLALDLARGLSYLHSKRIVHRDVKAENMLLDPKQTLKIADFGVARVEAQNPSDMTGETGTLGYMAPEVLIGKPYNRSCDVYSFGICLWEIYCCALPYPDLSFSDVSSAVVRQNLRPEIPRCCPSSLAQVMRKCWDSKPEKRPEMKDVVKMLESIDTSRGGGMIPEDESPGCFCIGHARGPSIPTRPAPTMGLNTLDRGSPSFMTDFLKQCGGCAVIDGGFATELERHGANINDPLWSAKCLMTSPQLVRRVHLDYLDAGANIILTASYQATIQGFQAKGLSREDSEALLRRSVEIANEAKEIFSERCTKNSLNFTENEEVFSRPILVAASIGSYGAYLSDGSEYSGNYGEAVSLETLKEFHRRRVQILADSGADLLAFETIPNKLEAQAYAELLEEENIQIPAWFSFNSKDGINVVSGDPIWECALIADSCKRVAAVGINCTSPRYILGLISSVRKVTSKPVLIYPNSGETYDPQQKEWVPSTGAGAVEEDFVTYIGKWREAGASLFGGCCRTTPITIRAISRSLSHKSASPTATLSTNAALNNK